MRALERAELDEGAIMLGALSLVCILFADDVVLLARCISDLQKLLDAFSDFCNTLHEQIALDKTEAVLFTPKSCNFSVRDGNLYRNVSRSVSREIRLELKQQPVKWSSFFKYLGIKFLPHLRSARCASSSTVLAEHEASRAARWRTEASCAAARCFTE